MLKVTILGCGASGGTPLIGQDNHGVDLSNPKNHRTRASIFLETAHTKVLVDTGPDMRAQLLGHNISTFDAVLYTHEHADHVHGIDDLRTISYNMGRTTIPILGNAHTIDDIRHRFAYLFTNRDPKDTSSSPTYFMPFLEATVIEPGHQFSINEMKVMPFLQNHGSINSLGFRIGSFAYSTDVVKLDEDAFKALEGVDVWVVDCLGMEPVPSHSHLEQTLEWIERVKPKKAYLTHMGFRLDYDKLIKQLPPHVEPAYDGLVINLP